MYIQILLLLDAQQTSPPRQALQRETSPALAQVGTFRSCLPEPTVPAPLSGVAVTSQILCISITLNKGINELFCFSLLFHLNRFRQSCQAFSRHFQKTGKFNG